MISRGEDVRMVHLSEINTVIIDSTQVSLTSYLLCELVKRKIKVIFCDEKRNPCSELMSYYGAYNSSKKIRKQIQWDMEYAKEIKCTLCQGHYDFSFSDFYFIFVCCVEASK